MDRKLKVGIIGMGRMGITHFSIINSHPDVEITSISDSSKMLLSLFSKYLPQVQVFQDYREQLEKSPLDAILICTPPTLHYDICKLAFEKRLHVFCEKPFTSNPAQANELAKLFEGSGLVNQVGYVNRFNNVFRKARQLVKNGVVGPIIRFRSEMFSATVVKPSEGKGWRGSRESGGGVTYEMASHAIDLINYIYGAPTGIIGSVMDQVFSNSVEDIVSSTFTYGGGGATGMLYVNWCDTSYRKPANKLEFVGANGKVMADQYTLRIFLNQAAPKENLAKGWNNIHITDVAEPVPFYVRGNEFTCQLYAFADQALGKTSANPGCTFREGAAVQDQIAKIFADAEKNKEENR